ncbi:MAG TPA: hypothetical protein VHL11_02005 [Phototrophicaceae bacterium]|jgi:sortase (surface protein transpeptidase)|nr:hypothetical protein [Phototrophicaceae bacterium]
MGTGLLDSVNGVNGHALTVQHQPVVVGSLHGIYPGDDIIVEQYGRDWRYTVTDVIQINDDTVQLVYPVEDERYTFINSERIVDADGVCIGYILIVAKVAG